MILATIHTTTPSWLTLLLFACLICIAGAKIFNAVKFQQFIELVITNKYFLIYGKNVSPFSFFNLLLLLVQIFAVSIFIFLFLVQNNEQQQLSNALFFFQIVAFYTLFIGLKYYLEKLIANLFSIDSLISNYLFQKLSYRNLIALLILFFNFLIVYSFEASQLIFIVFTGIVLLLNLFSLIYSYKTYQKQIKANLFYFILYLCTLEISPYILVYKLLS